MNELDFSSNIRARKEEIEELEKLVDKYALKMQKSAVSSFIKSQLIKGYRQGVIDTLDFLDQKAQMQAIERDMKKNFVQAE